MGNMMKYQAVFFDLGGTLTYPFYWSEYVEVRSKIASILYAPDDDITRVWMDEGYQFGAGMKVDSERKRNT